MTGFRTLNVVGVEIGFHADPQGHRITIKVFRRNTESGQAICYNTGQINSPPTGISPAADNMPALGRHIGCQSTFMFASLTIFAHLTISVA